MKFGCVSMERGSMCSDGDRVINIGDHFQLLAVMNLYHRMGLKDEDIIRIEYYDLFDYDGEDVVLPINFIWFNPFYGNRELVLSEKVHPVFLGIHCIGDTYSEVEIEYLKKNEPIGCRDTYTYRLLSAKGVRAYLHGCLTATFSSRKGVGENSRVFLVDIPNDLYQHIPKEITSNAVKMSHQYYGCKNIKWEEKAKTILREYEENASLIVTSRLHCASPCVALGIPVIFVNQSKLSSFSWIDQLLTIYDEKTWHTINWKPDRVEYEELKIKIIDKDIQRINAVMMGKVDEGVFHFFDPDTEPYQEFDDRELVRIKCFANEMWKNERVEYAIWGITQIAEKAYKFLNDHFPSAKLVGVYDNYKKSSFHGYKPCSIDEYNVEEGVYLIATGDTTSIVANNLFNNNEWDKRYLCTCYEGLHGGMNLQSHYNGSEG